MSKFRILLLMQLSDNTKARSSQTKERMRRWFIELLKTLAVAAVSYVVFLLLTTYVFTYDELPMLLVLVTSVTSILSTAVASVGLMKSLYFAQDNRVLITLPVATNLIFMSKLVVFYMFEVKKNLTFFLPIFLSGLVILLQRGLIGFPVLLWAIPALLFILMLPVLAGALISIPLMYIVRFFRRFQVLQAILSIPVVAGLIWLIVFLIGKIPQNIDLINRWPDIKAGVKEFLVQVENKFGLFSHMVYGTIGERGSDLKYHLCGHSFLRFGGLVLVCAALFCAVFFLSRPLFFGMMSKNFETDKSEDRNKPNVRRNRYFTFVKKEFFIAVRSVNVSLNYLIAYIAIPILIMFLNALYHVMDTRQLGDLLIYTFNVLLICLPFLASNALVATYYSSEGRAGYLKRTKPIYALYPLFTKLFFNMLFSIPAVFITVFIFGSYSDFTAGESLTLGGAVLLLHFAHMIYSAMLDIMNPQNEQYATSGGEFDNPNQNKSTLHAFLWSAVFAVCAYKFLSEATIGDPDASLLPALLKLLLIGGAACFSVTFLFVKRIRAFYYELQG